MTAYNAINGIPGMLNPQVRRILKEENVSMNCGYHMMHFLHHTEEDPFYFVRQE